MARLLIATALLLLAAPAAQANVIQADGRVIPADASELKNVFNQQFERLDPVAEAFTGTGTFTPRRAAS